MSDEEKAAAPAGGDAEEQSVEERVRNAVKDFVGKADLDTMNFKAVKNHITELFGKAVYKQTKDSVKKWAQDEVQRLHDLREGADGAGEDEAGEEEEEEEEGDDGEAYEEEEEEEDAQPADDDDDDDDEDYGASSSRKRLRKGKSKKRRLKRGARDSDDDEDAEDDDEDEAPRGRKQRKKSACPVKKARGAYILFSLEQRPVIKEENPSATFKEMGSLLGEAWKALSDEDRAKWSDAAAEDKKRYEREYKEWAESNPDEAAAEAVPAGKIPRKRGAPSSAEQRRKRQKQQAESGGEESDGGADKGGKDSVPKSHFDLAAQRVKRSTNRRVREEDIDLERLKEAASAFVARMLHAAQQDEEDLRRGRPAVHKIKMIGEVLTQVNKRSTVQEILLDAGLLRAFKDWLTPADPGSLPNARIREAIYDLLGRMHLDAYYLEQSDGLGRRLMDLRNNKRETEANRARLNAMMDRWARDIFQLQTKYRGLASHEGQQVAEIARRKRAVQNAKTTPFAEPTYTKRARIPEPAAFDYAVRPNERSEAQTEDASLTRARQRMVARHNQGGRRAAIMKRVKDRSRSKNASSQAHSVNVEGH